MRRRPTLALAAVLMWSIAAPAAAQVSWRDLVFTGGMSFEGYQGNLSAITVPVVDSVDQASAAIGELGVRGDVLLIQGNARTLSVGFDGGLRQFAAAGFELRDYAPREWVGSVDAQFVQGLSDWGVLQAVVGAKGRRVEDRTPIPLFLQPGYAEATGILRFQLAPIRGMRLDAEVTGEISDFQALDLVSQLDLLDRRSAGLELGAEWGERWTMRFYGGYVALRYPEQGSFDPTDPFRRDGTVRLGTRWRYSSFAQVGVEGTLNRSNSRRPEYNAISVNANLFAPLPAEFGLSLYGVFTAKSYLTRTEFARLIPGEEADNASIAYAELSRPLAANLVGAVRFGWTRAETDIGDSYYQRYGGSFLLRYRP